MVDENHEVTEDIETSSTDNKSYFLFLVLILLFMGNSSTLNKYFSEFKEEMEYINKIFHTMDATAEGLKTAFETPQKVQEELRKKNNL